MTSRLRVESVRKYFGGIKALDGLSFEVMDGESLALIGPNGAGKTTVFSLIMGEHRLTSGAISLDGTQLDQLPVYKRVGLGVARTYQIPKPFFGLSVVENIRVGRMPAGLFSLSSMAPDLDAECELAVSVGFDKADFDKLPSELSMGDLRKLEMARTLASNPSVVLLDEVFAGLTLAEIEQISKLIDKQRALGMTFVIVSHDLRSLEPLVDRAVAMNFGRQLAAGSFTEVMQDSIVRQSYLGTQTG